MTVLLVLTLLSFVAWVWLLLFHCKFWQADQRLNVNQVNALALPAVTAVIPARDEAETIATTVRALLDQEYPKPFPIVVVDDGSKDGTAEAARGAAVTDAERARVIVIEGAELPAGWTGKMWAVKQGIDAAPASDYLLLTDADILHARTLVTNLVAKAEGEGLALVSLMVRLRCRSLWEHLLVPAFVYFFQKLYPFPRVNDPARREAAAAGGCMLVRRETLGAAGGIEEIRSAVIDDCALARLMKAEGPIWLGLAERTESLRAYDDLGSVWRMVARTAYVQLRHNPLLLAGTVVGMLMLYALPPVAMGIGFFTCNIPLAAIGGGTWAVMAWTFLPTLDLYRVSPLWSLTLPAAGALYALMTLDSARRHYARSEGQWKGRRYDP